jgi:hypothetical protein
MRAVLSSDVPKDQRESGPRTITTRHQGELGPVGGKNFIRGFTASVAFLD